MYGMVNQAIRSMVLENLGTEVWEEICDQEKLDPTGFCSFNQYEDKLTANLVGHVSAKLKKRPEEVLEAFGIYWIEYAKKSEYQSILMGFASNPIELIESLDSLHSRLQLSFENLKAPSFYVTDKKENSILVHYKSQRKMGLEHFVVGLIKGMFGLFDQKCQVEILPNATKDAAVFKVLF